MFFSAADDDDGGNAVELMEWLYSLSPNPGSRFEHYSVGGHGVEMFEAHKELPGLIVEWFVTTLIKTPGRAPVMNAKTSHVESPNILAQIDEPGGAAKVEQKLAEARKRDPHAVLFSEGIVNYLGYECMQDYDTKEAVEILKLNVSAYPDSPNAYDSLADAYLADGQKGLALQCAKKALALLSQDTRDPEDRRKAIKESAEGKIKQLGGNSR
jgi:tetratricopeptide (TPR) repeat protein